MRAPPSTCTTQPGNGEGRGYKTLLARPEDDRVASPVNHLDRRAPPLHIAYGEGDFARIERTGREMAEVMRRRRYTMHVEEWAGADHFGTHLALKYPRHPWYERLRGAFAGAREMAGC